MRFKIWPLLGLPNLFATPTIISKSGFAQTATLTGRKDIIRKLIIQGGGVGMAIGLIYTICNLYPQLIFKQTVQDGVPQFTASFSAVETAAIWKADGREIAVQSSEGVMIRDSKTLRAKYFLSEAVIRRSFTGGKAPKQWIWTLVAWHGDCLVFAQQTPETSDKNNYCTGKITLLARTDGRKVTQFADATLTEDRSSLYFTDGKGHFRVLNFGQQQWFNIHLPLRINLEKSEYANYNPFSTPTISFSPDGKWASDQTKEGWMRLWNVQTGKISAILKDRVYALAYPAVMAPVLWSPDGTEIATLGEDPSHHDIVYEEGPNDGAVNEHPPVIKVWNARSGKLLQWFEVPFFEQNETRRQLHWLDSDQLFVGGTNQYRIRSISRKAYISFRAEEDMKLEMPYSVAPDGSRIFSKNRIIPLFGQTKITHPKF